MLFFRIAFFEFVFCDKNLCIVKLPVGLLLILVSQSGSRFLSHRNGLHLQIYCFVEINLFVRFILFYLF